MRCSASFAQLKKEMYFPFKLYISFFFKYYGLCSMSYVINLPSPLWRVLEGPAELSPISIARND